MPTKGREKQLTLPEGQEDDRLHHEEFEDWAIGTEQLTCGEVEKEEGIQCQADRDVIDDRHVEVATGYTAKRRYMNAWNFSMIFSPCHCHWGLLRFHFLPASLSPFPPWNWGRKILKPTGFPLPSFLTCIFHPCCSPVFSHGPAHTRTISTAGQRRGSQGLHARRTNLLKVTILVLAKGLKDDCADRHEGLHHTELQGGLQEWERGNEKAGGARGQVPKPAPWWCVHWDNSARQHNPSPTRSLTPPLANRLCLRTAAPKRR